MGPVGSLRIWRSLPASLEDSRGRLGTFCLHTEIFIRPLLAMIAIFWRYNVKNTAQLPKIVGKIVEKRSQYLKRVERLSRSNVVNLFQALEIFVEQLF